MAAIFLAWPIWRLGFPMEINRNEAWNAWFIDAVRNGTPLYPGRDDLIVNNYPPLAFYIVAFASDLIGNTIIAGRLISVFATAVVSAAAAFCIRALGGSRSAAAFGGFWLLATLSQFFPRYVGVNDPSLLALALMGSALALFLYRHAAGRPVEPAIALMVLAGFTKQNIPAIPLTALIWMMHTDKRKALRAISVGVGLCAMGMLLCAAAFGSNFAEQMLMPREISLKHILTTLNKLQWIAPALLCWALWAWPNRKQNGVRFTALLFALSLISGLLQAAGAGVTYNAYFELVFASAIGVALGFEGIASATIAKRFGAPTIQIAMIVVLALRLVLSQALEPYLVLASPAFRSGIRQVNLAVDAEVARIRSMPGRVSCSIMTVCYLAGKAFVYDGFWVDQRIAKGELTTDAVNQVILREDIRFEPIDSRAEMKRKRLF